MKNIWSLTCFKNAVFPWKSAWSHVGSGKGSIFREIQAASFPPQDLISGKKTELMAVLWMKSVSLQRLIKILMKYLNLWLVYMPSLLDFTIKSLVRGGCGSLLEAAWILSCQTKMGLYSWNGHINRKIIKHFGILLSRGVCAGCLVDRTSSCKATDISPWRPSGPARF